MGNKAHDPTVERTFVRAHHRQVQPEGRAEAAARDAARAQGQGPQVRRRPASTTAATTSSRRTASRQTLPHPPRGIRRRAARSQKHGHVNEAAFYILDGKGYEIHDGIRYDWKAGDVAIVHNNCVHQHFNAEPRRAGARAGDQDQADVHVHEHAVPAARWSRAERSPLRRGEGFVPRERRRTQSPGGITTVNGT